MPEEIKKKKIADIVRAKAEPKKPIEPRKPVAIQTPRPVAEKPAAAPAMADEEEKLKEFEKEVEKFEKEETAKFKEEEILAGKKKLKFKIKFKTAILLFIILALAGGLVYSALAFLPQADIKIIAKKTNWEFNDSIIVGKSVNAIDASGKQLPAELFSQRKNLTLTFPATGKQQVERKAKGKITVYNAYSSNSQTLVAATRFAAPDGKTFRLDSKLTVPGAKVSEGKIVPSSVEAYITADKAGAEYNVGPMSRLTIPGFSGTPKFQGFYGTLEEALTGGFVGEIAAPTEADAQQGREKTVETLKKNLEVFVLAQIPPDLKLIEGGEQFTVIKENIAKEADASGAFPVFIEAEYSLLVFRETDLLNMLKALANNILGAELAIKSYQLEYGVGRTDFAKGQLSFPINFKGIFWKPIDAEKLKRDIRNKNEEELKTIIFSLAGVEKATASFWPFWVKSAPNNLNRITVGID
jgi:hypothetical protein